MQLKPYMTNPLPEPPENIKQVAQSYLKSGESYNIYSHRGLLSDQMYYFVTFYKGKLNFSDPNKIEGILIVHSDGTLPVHADCIKPYHLIAITDFMLKAILRKIGAHWIKRSNKQWEDILSILNQLYPLVEQSHDVELHKCYQTFKEIPETYLSTQKEIKKVVDNGLKLFQELTTDYIVTEDFYMRVKSEFNHMMNCVGEQFRVQAETEEERRKFLKKIKQEISLFDLRNQALYHRLKKHHKSLKVDDEALQDYNEIKHDMTREKASQSIQQKQINSIRNPKE